MDQPSSNVHESEEANQIMNKKFKDYNARNISAADSEVGNTNQIIQRKFYENDRWTSSHHIASVNQQCVGIFLFIHF